MSKQKIPYIISIILIAFACVCYFVDFDLHSRMLGWILTVFIFPILLYGSHLFFSINSKRSYLTVLLVDIIFFLAPNYVGHLLDIEYSDDAKIIMTGQLMIIAKLSIIIIFTIINFVLPIVKKKNKSMQ